MTPAHISNILLRLASGVPLGLAGRALGTPAAALVCECSEASGVGMVAASTAAYRLQVAEGLVADDAVFALLGLGNAILEGGVVVDLGLGRADLRGASKDRGELVVRDSSLRENLGRSAQDVRKDVWSTGKQMLVMLRCVGLTDDMLAVASRVEFLAKC